MPSLRADIRIDSGSDLTPYIWDGVVQIMHVSRETCPVLTGALRDSHSVEFVGRNHAAIVVQVEHASYVEFGTYKMRAQPYLGPAIQAGLPLLMQDLASKEYEQEQGRAPSDAWRFLTAAAVAGIIEAGRRLIEAAREEHERMLQGLGLEPAR